MNHKSSGGLSKVSLLHCTKRNIAALISPTLRVCSPLSRVRRVQELVLDVVCGQGPLTPGKRSARVESSCC